MFVMAKAKLSTLESTAPPDVFDPNDQSDPHFGIPLAEDGNPEYFVLPDGVRVSYQRQMARCEQGWKATGNPGFVKEAQLWAFFHRQPSPLWLVEAGIALAERRAREDKGYTKRALAAVRDQMRFEAVLAAPEPRTCSSLTTRKLWTWTDRYKFAARELIGTRGAGGWKTAKRSYQQVKREGLQRRRGRFLLPLPTFGRKLRDVLDGKHRPKNLNRPVSERELLALRQRGIKK
jgi:hypothetical protein